jgi:predicted DNA-binding transcriptional regulator YafY
LKLWELLCQNTDVEHPMGTPEILERLAEMGIDCDRRTLYDDIKTLNHFGYEVECVRGASNEYSVDRGDFDVTELRILMDAVEASNFITEKKTKEFVGKIASLAGSRRAEVLKRNVVAFNSAKSTNEHIYYIVNEIANAINEKKKIEFSYFDYNENHECVYRKDGKKYLVNPYATVLSGDKYYLACYDDKHGNIAHYRVDRMKNVLMTDEPISPSDKIKDFDITKHKTQVFDMFVGETKTVKMKISKKLIDIVFDKFGIVKMNVADDGTIIFSAPVQVSPMFISWACSFGKELEVLSPPTVVNEVKEHIALLYEQYNKK